MPEFPMGVHALPEEVDEQDREAWFNLQAVFFAPQANPTPKGKAKAKARPRVKGSRRVVLSRKTAAAYLSAVDHVLVRTRGVGLEVFLASEGGVGDARPLGERPLLVLSFDEASPNMAMFFYMAYHLRLRVVAIRDVFHREWNDAKLAVKGADLWWVV